MANSLPIWQAALLTQGCQVRVGRQFFPLELRPVNDRILCTPSVSGSLLPFNVSVNVGESVTIAWNAELSRYIVTAGGMPEAA
jgi:hypothetical protein